ncbi:MAG: hypothetical protein HY718_06985, partial [Planctomycetes bacterium]|nr:hypothetical protein [Planctomycetota bacterium]
RPAGDDTEFVHPSAAGPGIDLLYLDGGLLGTDKHQQTTVRRISDRAARIEVSGEDSTRTLLVCADADTGDVRILPDGLSSRRGLRAVGWTLSAHPDAAVILPCVNGLRFRSNQPHPPSHRFAWPMEWNAQLVILEQGEYSAMVHCEDRTRQFKALQLTRQGDRTDLGFDTEPPGPLWDNRTAGGIEWRVNTYRGNWRVPATRYRQWLLAGGDLRANARHRPDWVDGITLAVCWAAAKPEMLDALAAVHPPARTLIHLSDWRTDKYDVNYPDYTPTDKALQYMAKARQLGFHVMPHFNYFSVYYKHPFFQTVGDFQVRSLDKNEPQGWHWPPETHDYTRMGYIHPGLGAWRSKLIDVVGEACDRTGTGVAFIDQTLCTWNTDNGLVQGMNTIEGMRQLHDEFDAVRPELLLAGEGLNEVSFQRQGFAQGHIFQGWGKLEQKHVDAQHGICQLLWGSHTRLIGYYHLNPGNEDFEKGIEVYERMGAVPTIVTNNPKDLSEPSPLTKRILDRARGLAVSRPD